MTEPTLPVVLSGSGDVIGHARTRLGAIRCVRHVPKWEGREQWSASVHEVIDRDDMPDFTLAWFVTRQLKR